MATPRARAPPRRVVAVKLGEPTVTRNSVIEMRRRARSTFTATTVFFIFSGDDAVEAALEPPPSAASARAGRSLSEPWSERPGVIGPWLIIGLVGESSVDGIDVGERQQPMSTLRPTVTPQWTEPSRPPASVPPWREPCVDDAGDDAGDARQWSRRLPGEASTLSRATRALGETGTLPRSPERLRATRCGGDATGSDGPSRRRISSPSAPSSAAADGGGGASVRHTVPPWREPCCDAPCRDASREAAAELGRVSTTDAQRRGGCRRRRRRGAAAEGVGDGGLRGLLDGDRLELVGVRARRRRWVVVVVGPVGARGARRVEVVFGRGDVGDGDGREAGHLAVGEDDGDRGEAEGQRAGGDAERRERRLEEAVEDDGERDGDGGEDAAQAVRVEEGEDRGRAERRVVAPQARRHLGMRRAEADGEGDAAEGSEIRDGGGDARRDRHPADDERARDRRVAEEDLADGDERGVQRPTDRRRAVGRRILRERRVGAEGGREEGRRVEASELVRRGDEEDERHVEGERERRALEGRDERVAQRLLEHRRERAEHQAQDEKTPLLADEEGGEAEAHEQPVVAEEARARRLQVEPQQDGGGGRAEEADDAAARDEGVRSEEAADDERTGYWIVGEHDLRGTAEEGVGPQQDAARRGDGLRERCHCSIDVAELLQRRRARSDREAELVKPDAPDRFHVWLLLLIRPSRERGQRLATGHRGRRQMSLQTNFVDQPASPDCERRAVNCPARDVFSDSESDGAKAGTLCRQVKSSIQLNPATPDMFLT